MISIISFSLSPGTFRALWLVDTEKCCFVIGSRQGPLYKCTVTDQQGGQFVSKLNCCLGLDLTNSLVSTDRILVEKLLHRLLYLNKVTFQKSEKCWKFPDFSKYLIFILISFGFLCIYSDKSQSSNFPLKVGFIQIDNTN